MLFSFHERRRIKQFFFSKLVLAALAGLVVLVALGTWDVFQKERETALKRAEAERELAELREREQALRAEIERLETDIGLERELRSKFEVGREGEGVIVIVDPKESEQAASARQSGGFFGRLLDLFR